MAQLVIRNSPRYGARLVFLIMLTLVTLAVRILISIFKCKINNLQSQYFLYLFLNNFLFCFYLRCKLLSLGMAKVAVTIKIESNLKPVLEKIADIESRSQGGQIEAWIKKDAKRLNIEIAKPAKP